MIRRQKKEHLLLDHPLLSDSEVAGLLQDVDALKAGRITGVVDSPLWQRAMAEFARLHAKREIEESRSLTHATWFLAVITGLLAIATIVLALTQR